MGIEFESPEGATPIDPNESAGLIPNLTTQQELNEFEAANILYSMGWAESSSIVEKDLLAVSTLKLLHQKMFDKTWKWAGRFRLTQKSIGVEAYRIPSELQSLVDDVSFWIAEESYPPDEVGARFHHRLVLIHPFENGNGRHARLATDLLCRNQGWPLFSWGIGSADARAWYLDALRQADRHNFALLVEFVRS